MEVEVGAGADQHYCCLYVSVVASRLEKKRETLSSELTNSLGAETRTQKNSPHKCLIQILNI